jgi:hypothetical protein
LPGFRLLHCDKDYRLEGKINQSGEGIIYAGLLLNDNMIRFNNGQSQVAIKVPKSKYFTGRFWVTHAL